MATPLDPRHRLVTTKYNPARTWTPENAVGIGGAYLCIYGMEGPGGYQFVGRTVQMWNRFRRAGLFAEQPWLLRFFDQIRFYPVGEQELLDLRAESARGAAHVDEIDGHVPLWPTTARSCATRDVDRRVQAPAGRRSRRSANAGAAGECDRAETGRAVAPDASADTDEADASAGGGDRGARDVPRSVWQLM